MAEEASYFEVTKGRVLLVKGPASITNLEGAWVMGVRPEVGERISVRRGKVMPVESIEERALVKVYLGERGEASMSNERVGCSIWLNIANEVLLELGAKRIAVIGATDSGKSTLSMMLANRAIELGMAPGILDLDMGQGDLAPPGAIGALALKAKAYDLRELRAELLGFIGSTSPYGLTKQVIDEAKRLLKELECLCRGPVVVNTDGYIDDGGAEYKAQLLTEAGIEAAICLGVNEGLESRLREAWNGWLIRAERPSIAGKSPSERLERRLSQYRRFLSSTRRLKVRLESLGLVFLNRHYRWAQEGPTSLVFEGDGERLIIARGEAAPFYLRSSKDTTIAQGLLNGMLVALWANRSIVGFGIIDRVFANELVLAGNFLVEPDALSLSCIRLSRDLRDEWIIPLVRLNSQ